MYRTVYHNSTITENSPVSSPSMCPLSLKEGSDSSVDTCVFFFGWIVSNLWTQSIFSPCVRITCGHHRAQFLYFFQINTYFSFYTNGTVHHTLFCLFFLTKTFYWNNSLYIEKKFLFEFALCLWWWNCRSLPFIFLLLLLLSLNFSFMY